MNYKLDRHRPKASLQKVQNQTIQNIFKETIEPNIKKGVYDKAGTAGVTKQLIFSKGAT